MVNRVRGFAAIVAMVARDQPWRFVATMALSIAYYGAEPALAVGLKVVIDFAADRDAGAALLAAVGVATFLGVQSLFGWANLSVRMRFREGTAVLIESELARLAATAHGLEHHERPDYLDTMSLLREQGQQLAAAPDSIITNVAVIVQFLTTVGLLATVNPALLLLPVAAFPSLALSGLSERYLERRREVLAPLQRRERYLIQLSHDVASGKEIRVFGLANEVVRRFNAVEDELERRQRTYAIWSAFATAGGWLFFGAGFIIALVVVAHQAIAGAVTAGDMVLALALASRINGQVGGLVDISGWIVGCTKTAARYQWLVDYAREQRAVGHPPDAMPIATDMGHSIEFAQVGFQYRGTTQRVLRDIDLTLPAGSTIAIVGENGGGKSTLVKILCRFYDPTSGAVMVDGVDLRKIDVDDWRANVAGAFQDFARFEFLAADAVGIGDLARLGDLDAIMAALERALAGDVTRALPAGLQTQLGRSFDGGVELSFGQWQKLALGRAMMRTSPRVLVLDEPTASLDAPTEHALFERLAAAMTGSKSITVFVSHRFSTARMADVIVVVDGGQVIETGTHADLMARGGTYAELYELQARGYR